MKKVTPGPWKVEDSRIVSTTEWIIPPDPDDHEEGIGMGIVDCHGSLGGEDGDIHVLAASWEMLEVLKRVHDEVIFSTRTSLRQAVISAIRAAEGRE